MARRKPQIRKIDGNQNEIVAALTAAGLAVQSLGAIGAGCPDLLVANRNGSMMLMEVKMPGEKLRDSQHEWIGKWPATVWVVDGASYAVRCAVSAGLL